MLSQLEHYPIDTKILFTQELSAESLTFKPLYSGANQNNCTTLQQLQI